MIRQSPELDQLAAALIAAQKQFTTLPKDATNPFFKSKYVSLPKVVEIASPIIAYHGLTVTQHLDCDERGDTLTTVLLHVSGQYIAGTMRLHLTKQEPQSQGSATTYARRFSYMAVLGLVADEDDDGNATRRTNDGNGYGGGYDGPYDSSPPPKANSPATASRPAPRPQGRSSSQTQASAELLKEIAQLSSSNQTSLEARRLETHFPPFAQLSPGAVKQVRKWIEELLHVEAMEEPF